MRTFWRALYLGSLNLDGETRHLLSLLESLRSGPASRVLDVGCGYGRLLAPVHRAGMDVTGVDVNPQIVAANREHGLRCLTAEEFRDTTGLYDIVVMAHVIEHFRPDELLVFMDSYLDRLKPGGRLIIATPLMSDYFYDDFDHVKPYQPTGILMVFGADAAQVRYYARNRLVLRDIWYRRSPLRLSHSRLRYVRTPWRYALIAADFLCALVYLLSARIIGKTNGWVGVFEKTDSGAPAMQDTTPQAVR
jgi:SAM-dependent methyltransferase